MTEYLIFFSIPGLRPADITQAATPTLYGWANKGAMAELLPTFPAVTSCVQASMLTASPPSAHGVIANGFYHRDRRAVEFWVGHNGVMAGRQTWDVVRARRPEFTAAVWHAQNIKGAGADVIVTPSPIHEPDGATKLWCYSKPDGLYQQLIDALGHFPLQHYWGPLANIESTRWILNAALWLIRKHPPNYHWIYIPHLDYASQKFGPNSSQARIALTELDQVLSEFAAGVAATTIGGDAVHLVAGEYALVPVSSAVYPNRLLREAGLLSVRQEQGAELIDFSASAAIAMVDHQFAHVFVNPEASNALQEIAAVLTAADGVASVWVGSRRADVGLDHPRSGDLVILANDDRWFAYYWWLDDAAAPAFATTVDIHRKPGYDPVELFFDPHTRGIPLNAELVKGSHGLPATGKRDHTALICSALSSAVVTGRTYRDTDVQRISLESLGL